MITRCPNNIIILRISNFIILIWKHGKPTNFLRINGLYKSFLTYLWHTYLIRSTLERRLCSRKSKIKMFKLILFVFCKVNYNVSPIELTYVFFIFLHVETVVSEDDNVGIEFEDFAEDVFHLRKAHFFAFKVME